jgi:hypothetical protein
MNAFSEFNDHLLAEIVLMDLHKPSACDQQDQDDGGPHTMLQQ